MRLFVGDVSPLLARESDICRVCLVAGEPAGRILCECDGLLVTMDMLTLTSMSLFQLFGVVADQSLVSLVLPFELHGPRVVAL